MGLLCLLAFLVAGAAVAQNQLPTELERVGLDQKIGAQVPSELRFTDHEGNAVTLGDYLGDKPLLLAPVYYDCPMLCTMVLEGLFRSLKAIPLDAGSDFDVLAVSFDPTEGPEQASGRRTAAVERYGRPETEAGLHFLTGDSAAVATLMDTIGFRYRYNEETGEFAHVSTIVVLTPEGAVARYFPGVEYPARDLRLSMVEAADNKIGTAFDTVLLYCFTYDPTTGRYTAATMNLIRAGGALTLLVMGAFIALSLRRDRLRGQAAGASL